MFIRIGVGARAELLAPWDACGPSGFAWVNGQQRTRVPRVWAAGDICEEAAPSVATAVGTGMRAAKDVYQTLRGRGAAAEDPWL